MKQKGKISDFLVVVMILLSVLTVPVISLAEDQTIIIDYNGQGYSESAGWKQSTAVKGYQNSTTGYSATKGSWVMYTPEIKTAAPVRISLFIPVWKEKNDNKVKVEINAEGKTETKEIDFSVGSSGWVDLGTYSFDGKGGESVKVTRINTNGNIFTRSDAAKFEINPTGAGGPAAAVAGSMPAATPTPAGSPTQDIASGNAIIIDNGDSGFLTSEGWKESTTVKGYNGSKSAFCSTKGNWAMYKPQMKVSGQVKISMFNLVYKENQDLSVKVEIFTNGSADVKNIDQSKGKSGWVELGTYTFAGDGEEYVKITRMTASDGKTVTRADAMKFELQDGSSLTVAGSTATPVPLPSALTITGVPTEKTFEDTVGHWAKDDIDYMASKGYVKGISETLFEPETQINRAEFVTLLTRILNIAQSIDANSYPDVQGNWYTGYIGGAFKAGILEGMPQANGGFAPEQPITRQEMSLLMGNAVKYLGKDMDQIDENGILAGFTDAGRIADWARKSVAQAVKAGIIKGYTDTTFEPLQNATRAQATVMMKRLLDIE